MCGFRRIQHKRETRRRLESLPASFRPYMVWSIRKTFSGSGLLDEGEEEKTGENCGRVSADVNSNELTLGEGKGDRGAEIKVLQVDIAEDGIVGDSGV